MSDQIAEAAKSSVKFEIAPRELKITQQPLSLSLSLDSPHFLIDNAAVGEGVSYATIKGNLAAGEKVEATYPVVSFNGGDMEVKLYLQWSQKEQILRKWVKYRLIKGSGVLRELTLDDLPAAGWQVQGFDWMLQSSPAFGNGFFAGIEFPVAVTRTENNRLFVAHRPGIRLQQGVWYESKKAVYGVAGIGQERRAFQKYISSHRPKPASLHVNYNSWWTAPFSYTEKDILSLMNTFEEQLYKPYGVSFDTFCIDMGWSDPHSLWDIDKKLFPEGFTNISEAAHRMHSSLGLWVSPGSCYPPALDNAWAQENGYETYFARPGESPQRYACLAGIHYKNAFRDRLVELATKYGIRHFKFDGFYLRCNDSNHGHEPNEMSSEAMAEGGIEVFEAVRKAAPNAWLEATCFGWSPSPWWLFYVNSVIGTYGDDAPHGRVPSPVNRESYTTARDFYNLHGSAILPVPVVAQEVLGVVHQTDEPFTNDAVMTIMRGNAFLPLYINPACMNPTRWKQLAGLIKWARKNEDILQETTPLLPDSWKSENPLRISDQKPMPREPYGYIHWKKSRGLIVLRNPWIARTVYKLRLDESYGIPQGIKGLSAVSLYPETRLYGANLASGDGFTIPLKPYETLVLSVASRQKTNELLSVASAANSITAKNNSESTENNMLSYNIEVSSPQAKLLVLWTEENIPQNPECALKINGKAAQMGIIASDKAWCATGLPAREKWVWLEAPLSQGNNKVELGFISKTDLDKASIWVWSTKPGEPDLKYPNALPTPEIVSLDAVELHKSN